MDTSAPSTEAGWPWAALQALDRHVLATLLKVLQKGEAGTVPVGESRFASVRAETRSARLSLRTCESERAAPWAEDQRDMDTSAPSTEAGWPWAALQALD